MSGIAYELKKIKGVVFDVDGVLSPSVVPVDEDGQPVRMMNIKDGYALHQAIGNGLKIAVITGGKSETIKKRFYSIGISDVFTGISNKLPVLSEWMKQNSLSAEETAYMGDDIPDLKCMRAVGLPCAPYDAAYEAKETAAYVSRFSGGYGCVRDLLEQVLKAQGKWMKSEKAFNW